MRAAALGLDGPPPPRRAARLVECLVLFHARWLWRGAADTAAVARRVGVCNLPRRLRYGVYVTASLARRSAAHIASVLRAHIIPY